MRADEFSQTSNYAVRMFSTGTLYIDTRTGDLKIEGWDEPRLEVEAEKVVRASSEAKAQPLYRLIDVRLLGGDKEVHLTTVYPPRRLWRPFRDESKLSANLRIKMPFEANLNLRCVDGDVKTMGLTGNQQLLINYGDVEVNVPDVHRVRLFQAHTWIGYVQNDLHGIEQDDVGLGKGILLSNSRGEQVIRVKVRMGGVWVYSN